LVDCVCWVAHTTSLAFEEEEHLEFKNSMGPVFLQVGALASSSSHHSHPVAMVMVVVVVGFVYVEASSKVCLVCHDMQVHVPD